VLVAEAAEDGVEVEAKISSGVKNQEIQWPNEWPGAPVAVKKPRGPVAGWPRSPVVVGTKRSSGRNEWPRPPVAVKKPRGPVAGWPRSPVVVGTKRSSGQQLKTRKSSGVTNQELQWSSE
jgi:hypothetical protein